MCPGVLLRITFALTFLVYARTVTFDWVFDDHLQVAMNPWLDSWRSLKLMFTLQSWAFSDFTMPAKFYRPMYLVWLLVNNKLFHGTPGWFHLSAVFLHLVVVYLAYLTARRLLRDDRMAVIAALIFALHPSKVGAVAWVSGATEVVHAAFFLGTVLAYLRWQQSENRAMKWLVVSVLCFAGAILSKETAILAPVLIAAHHWLTSAPETNRFRSTATLISPYLVVGLAYWIIRVDVLSGVAQLGATLSVAKTIYTIPLAFWWYILHTVWPFGLSLDYPVMIVRTTSFTKFILPAVGLLVLAGAYAWFTCKSTLQLMGLWFILTLIPPVGAILLLQPHDRYLYLPSFAVAIFIAECLSRLSINKTAAWVLVIAIAFTVGTYQTIGYWDSDVKIFARSMEKAPDNMVVRTRYAGALCDRGEEQKALDTLLAGYNRHPESATISYSLALIYFSNRQFDDARRFFTHTLSVAEDKRAKGLCHFHLGLMAQTQGNLTEANREFRNALVYSSTSAGFHQALGNVLRAQGATDEARAEFKKEQQIRETRTRNL